MADTETLVPPPSASASGGAFVIKHLASCSDTARDESLRLLNEWLQSQQQISEDDMKKVWKAIFYCVWHADKSIVQSELINDLSSLLLSLHLPLAVHYFSVFLLTIRREWTGLDGLRLDKFYLMIRRFLHCFFKLLKVNDWNLELITRLMTILEERTFFPNDVGSQNNGFDYHVASVFLEELKFFLPVDSQTTLDAIFKPFFSVMCKSKDKVLVHKVKSNVFDLLLKTGKSLLERKIKLEEVEDEIVNLGSIALAMRFSAKFYDLGSSPDCYQGNRKVCYGLHEQFMKLEKDLESSGVEISLPLSRVNDDEEKVPDLIPLVSDESSKKKKNKKKDKPVIKACSDKSKSSKKENENPIVTFNESVISNLQMQFEKVAAEIGLNGGNTQNSAAAAADDDDIPKVAKISKKKRKRSKSSNNNEVTEDNTNGEVNNNTSEKSGKKVRFSIKDNMVWKPQSPLPPQNLRIPPSVTPRGSALKKGIPPGPIRQVPAVTLKKKKKKKVRKPAAINRVWKL